MHNKKNPQTSQGHSLFNKLIKITFFIVVIIGCNDSKRDINLWATDFMHIWWPMTIVNNNYYYFVKCSSKREKKVRGGRRHKKLWSSCVRWRSVEIIIEWAREWQAVKQRYGKKWKLIYVWKFTLLFSDTSVFFFALRLYNFTLMIRLKWYHFAEKTLI